jgi:hypothetical protein
LPLVLIPSRSEPGSSSSHGQWGTDFDAAKDLARLDVATRILPEPVERFKAGITPDGNRGMLWFAWHRAEPSIRFTVK